jgi:hypothetical protein
LERLSLNPEVWCAWVRDFGRLFCHVAGRPQTVDSTRSRVRRHRFHVRRPARELLTAAK